uniref:Protein kinase domain-containing protein n=1 Tax=Esox lucius TaxID=8010 RepID=A0A6Q2X964_ESOLU
MLLHFCPQCGTKLQPGYRFCPSCGDKLPCAADLTAAVEATSSEVSQYHLWSWPVLSPLLFPGPPPQVSPTLKQYPQKPVVISLYLLLPCMFVVKGKAKKVKRVCAVEPLQEGEELCDTTGRKWRLVSLLSQSEAELFYGGEFTLKCTSVLGAKDGKIFNEQNFLQRAAKPSSVDKWVKQAKLDFLGVPACAGFGLHADSYRFLIFPNMGQTLQSFMDEGDVILSEKAVLQLACRILDVLEFIHKNEYVHADIHAENIYISTAQQTQVYLAGYGHAFRYCPGGRHVEYREGSRTPHEGAIEFISLESHKGAGPSRRSDLQALAYCLLRWHTGTLPWSSLTQTPGRVSAEKERFVKDIPGLMSHCFGQKKVSGALQSYLCQVMALQYSDQPDYEALRAGLMAALQKLGGSLEKPLDLQVNALSKR